MKFLNTDFLRDGNLNLRLTRTIKAEQTKNRIPAYYFDICINETKIGECNFRVGYNERVYYGGNIGYSIDEQYRGYGYAAKASRLLFELAKKHDMSYIIITCNPDNMASRKTCENLGCRLVETVELPEDNDMRKISGATHKCIYRKDFR